MNFTSKQIVTMVVAIAVIFVVLGALTYAIDSDDSDTNNMAVEDTTTTAKANPEEKPDEEGGNVVVNEPLDTDPYKELDELIGLEEVKTEVHSLVNFVKVQKMREKQGMKTPKLSYHLVFTGSPGTGKTTVARIVARIYKDLGILKRGHTVETDRSGLVGEYVGQTAPKTNNVIDSALNGVLFIDEAYALVPDRAHNDYGQEAISTLLKRMEDDRDRLVVIIAGYPNEMQRFIDSNPGLQSRFNRYINFPDYTPEELVRIFKMYLKKNEYTMSQETEDYLLQRIEYVVAHKNRNFGNARYMRNIFEKTIQHHANRLSHINHATVKQLSEVNIEDIQAALQQQTNIKHQQ